ncbi:MAG TPA: 4Fe-4S binding protein [Azospira sp.]|nr:4Fe-4S binding protein [Azospira sp.]
MPKTLIIHAAPPATPATPEMAYQPRQLRLERWLQILGTGMQRHGATIRAIQWAVVVFYFFLVAAPAFLPLPEDSASIVNNLTRFAQFLFWGIWWPFVMVSMLLLGRVWCGVFCPEGTLTEWVSHRGLNRPIPRWLKWGGWPFVAFVCTTVFGQLVSVYEYPKAALLVLGGSSIAAVAVGLVYGRGKRVWCRHLCPASGVFALLAKVAPVHFRVDRAAWDRAQTPGKPVNCAPLVDIRRMTGASDCHACGRCAGHREAVQLAPRRPDAEILASKPEQVSTGEAMTLLYGALGIATAAFQWTVSPWFVQMKTAAANWLIDRDAFLLLQDNAPWWLLTHYPEVGDVFTWLDGLCILAYILGGGALLGTGLVAGIALAARLTGSPALPWRRLALGLVPLGGVNVFLGLSMLTITLLKAEGLIMPWVPTARSILLALGLGGSAWLGLRLILQATPSWPRRLAALAAYGLPLTLIGLNWLLVFFIW